MITIVGLAVMAARGTGRPGRRTEPTDLPNPAQLLAEATVRLALDEEGAAE